MAGIDRTVVTIYASFASLQRAESSGRYWSGVPPAKHVAACPSLEERITAL